MTGTEIQCTRTLVEKLDHAKGLLAKAGGPGAGDLAQVLDAALDALITKKDPMKKAERSAQRVAKKLLPTTPCPEAGGPGTTRARPAIPARRVHNNFAAEEIMGIEFMAMKKAAALNRSQYAD